MSVKKGLAVEDSIRRYLCQQGLQPICSNYRKNCGEIDLIMQDGSVLVFIEVRSRASYAFGGAIASINLQKQKKIIKTASLYLLEKGLYDKQAVRFDVVGLEGTPAEIHWVKNAFASD